MNKLRKVYEIIGYVYDADEHCISCTNKRFYGKKALIDFEGNAIHPIFLGDELDTPPVCGDCLELLD